MSNETEYRGFIIKPKLDFGSGGYLINGRVVTEGFVAVKDGCNALPGATWGQTVERVQELIDVLIAVGGEENGELFWEIVQPWTEWPGDSCRDGDATVSRGRFRARVSGGVVRSVVIKPRVISMSRFMALRDLGRRRPNLLPNILDLVVVVQGDSCP